MYTKIKSSDKLFIKKAFTLAEVLITLSIIGVVAALTIPNLITKIKDQEHKSAFLKEYATAQNAFRQAAINNGGSLAGYSSLTGDTHERSNEFKDIVKPYLSYIKECNKDKVANCTPVDTYKTFYKTEFPPSWTPLSTPKTYPNAVLMMKDGSIWRFFAFYDNMKDCKNGFITDNNCCGSISIDSNGGKKPNQAGYDLFEFHIAADGNLIPMGNKKDKFKNSFSETIGYTDRINYFLGLPQD